MTCINVNIRWEREYKSDKEIMNSASSWIAGFTLIRVSLTSPVEQVWSVLDVYSFILLELRVT